MSFFQWFYLQVRCASFSAWICQFQACNNEDATWNISWENHLAFRSLVCSVQYTIYRISSRSILKYWKHHRAHTHKPSYSYQLTIQLNIEHNIDIGNFCMFENVLHLTAFEEKFPFFKLLSSLMVFMKWKIRVYSVHNSLKSFIHLVPFEIFFLRNRPFINISFAFLLQ